MNILFMGTPDFAVGALEAVIQAGHRVVCAVTQPDKPKGRGKELQMTPVKQCALKYNIPVFQPVKIKTAEAVAELKKYQADIFIVAAFGQLLSEEILYMPKYGSINIHASLLPRYRGAAPIQQAILDGEKETGITIMQMDKGLDTGDMLMKCTVAIDRKETGESLHDKLCQAGAELIVKALPLIEANKLVPEKQKEEEASYVKLLNKAMGHIDWTKDAAGIDRLVRGLNSWPSAYTNYNKKSLKIWDAEPENALQEAGAEDGAAPGTVVKVEKDAFYVQTGAGILKVTEVQPEGKKRMQVKDFLLGYALPAGYVFEG